MKKFLLLLLVFRVSAPVLSQDTITVGEIQKRVFLPEGWSHEIQVRSGRMGALSFAIHNDLQKAIAIDLVIPSADSITATVASRLAKEFLTAGAYVSALRWPFPENPGIIPIELGPDEVLHLSVRLWSDEGRPFGLHNIMLQTRERTLEESVDGFRNFIGRTEFNGFFLGATTFAMLFFLLIWLKVGQPVFLFYSLYLLGACVYSLIVKTLPYSYLAKVANIDFPLTYKLGEPVQYLFFAAYFAFAKELLDIDRRQKALDMAVRISTWLLLAAGIFLLAYNFISFDYQFQQHAFLISRLMILPVALTLLLWIVFKVNSPVKWFFVSGSSFFFLGGLLAVMIDPKSRHLFFGMTNLNPVIFFKTGILLECLCFALALGYKIRVQQKERDQATKAYVTQIELNHQMVEGEKQRLEKMVGERTQEILKKNQIIEEQKRAQLRSDMEKQLSEMEMKALRSQMNPHFIFNSLNSIRYQILCKDYEAAVTYLNTFSRLLRYVLQNSREHVVTLSEEIEMNRLYVQLEKLRFCQGFEFVLDIPKNVDASDIMVPPMLLQPYIENAVKHGLSPSKLSSKKLLVQIKRFDLGYYIIIEDNGVGRHATPRTRLKEGNQPLGMIIARERLELFNGHFKSHISVRIEDLYEHGLPGGTRILFTYYTN